MKVSEYRQYLPGAPAEFVLAAYESGETAESANRRWLAVLLAERDALKQAVESLKAKGVLGNVRT